MKDKIIIIIGAGPAGLTAAYEILKNTSYKPVILEESAYIGGISRTAVYKNNRMDLGGHRFFTKNEEVLKLWKDIMPYQGAPAKDDIILKRKPDYKEGRADPEKEEKVFLKRTRVSRIFFLRKFFNYPITLSFDTFYNMGLIRTIRCGIGYFISCICKRKENSLEDFYINRFGKPLYEMFFEDYTEKLWGVHPSKIAPDWGAQRVKGLSLFKVVVSVIMKPFKKKNQCETSLIEEFYYPKKGPGQFWEEMAEKIEEMGGTIIFNEKVNRIDVLNNKIAGIETLNNKKYENIAAVFSSMPIKDLISSMGDIVNGNVKEIAENLPYRDFITVGLLVKKLKIKNRTKIKTVSNIVPDCWIYIQERDVKIGRLQIFNNWSPYLVDDLENTVWIGLEYFCDEGDWMWNMPEEKFIEYAIDELCKIDVIEKKDVIDSTIIKVKKAYPAYFGTYNQFNVIREYVDSIDNLYCIGRNGQHRYNNMDHSMLTAVRAVEVFMNNKDKKEIWEVNIEEEYHEEKSEQAVQNSID